MMPGLSPSIYAIFIATTIITVLIFLYAARWSKTAIILLLGWLAVQSAVALTGFYTTTNTLPPRFVLLVGPALLFIIALFFIPAGRRFMDSLNAEALTYLHTVRIPVEITLYWLFLAGLLPQIMTFDGYNYDILSGLTASVVAYFGYTRKVFGKSLLIAWNITALGLVLTIVSIAIMSLPTPFQQLAFDQPNKAVMYFPFMWLPCCIVPLVIFSHLICLRQLVRG